MEMVDGLLKDVDEPMWLEEYVVGSLKVWQVIFLALAAFGAIVIALCCCIRFRVPRTKQQIEADYHRRIITRNFRKQLEKIQNSDMDALDLKAALEIVRADMKLEGEFSDGDNPGVAIIGSLPSPGQSFDESSLKSSHPLNEDETRRPRPSVTFGRKLVSLIRLTRATPSQQDPC